VGLSVAVGPDGVVHVVDGRSTGVGIEHEVRLQRYEPDGTAVAPQHLVRSAANPAPNVTVGLSADSSGNLYIGAATVLYKYAPDETTELNEIPILGSGGFLAFSIDPSNDHLYLGEVEPSTNFRVISEYDAAGSLLKRFGYGEINPNVTGLARRLSGAGLPLPAVYVAEGVGSGTGKIVSLSLPPAGPLIYPAACSAAPARSVKATLTAQVNPEGSSTSVEFEYVTRAQFEAEGFTSASKSTSLALGEDVLIHQASVQVTNLEPETEYVCRVVARSSSGESTGQTGSFETTERVEFGASWASEVGTDSAQVNTEINPQEIPTDGYFEYVDQASFEANQPDGFAGATKVPISPVGGEEFTVVSAALSGLTPGITYRYRLVAKQGTVELPDEATPRSFRTFVSESAALPDGRAYEMVSPSEKNSAEVAVPGGRGGLIDEASGYFTVQAGSSSGEAMTYTSFTSFGEPQSAPGTSQYLSRRGPGGWTTQNISLPGQDTNGFHPFYRGFTPDLRFAGAVVFEPALTPDAQQGFENAYLRDNESGALRALTTESPQLLPEQARYCDFYGGASTDGTRAFFAGSGAMAGAPLGAGFSLYESSPQGLQLVSVLPNGSKASPAEKTGFGAGSASCSSERASFHSISTDGSVVFWTYGGVYKTSSEPLLVRLNGSQTLQLDAREGSALGPQGGGNFLTATPDGSFAFFTAPGKLTEDAAAGGDLYRYSTGATSLLNLTPAAASPQVKGVLGASADGSYLYFVAGANLTGEQQGPSGEKAELGQNNLYLWHEGEGLRFIGTLTEGDNADWAATPHHSTARVTADGNTLAFTSIDSVGLAGYDNLRSTGGSCRLNEKEPPTTRCREVFFYDAAANQLACASCNPSGGRPAAGSTLPAWSNPFEGPRYLSEHGDRLFFESDDPLSLGDENGQTDVYEFERDGSGSCTSASTSFSPLPGGCVYLISGGKSTDTSYLLDASANGTDVFFATRGRLVTQDENDNYDVYDSRAPHVPGEAVGFAAPPIYVPCVEVEACRPPTTEAPSAPSSPGSGSFQGPGNPKPPGKKGKKNSKKHRHHAHKKGKKTGKKKGHNRDYHGRQAR